MIRLRAAPGRGGDRGDQLVGAAAGIGLEGLALARRGGAEDKRNDQRGEREAAQQHRRRQESQPSLQEPSFRAKIVAMKVATWNVNGIRARQTQFCEWLERERPDVVCLQELKAEVSQIPPQCQVEDYHVFWHGLRAYSGVSLHVRKGVFGAEPAFSHPDFDVESRIVQADMGDLVLASVYVPNGGKDYPAKLAFLERLAAWARRLHDEGRSVVLCGDINVARLEMDVHPRERKPGIIGQRPEERDLFARLLGEHLVDVGRALDPDNDRLFTWWPPWRNMRGRNIGWRLDYVLASPSVASRARSCAVQADFGTSDHAPVLMRTE
jgi:exodeoxyribonuclease III